MNENTKTIGFVVAAVAVVTLALVLRHEERFEQVPEEVGQKLFPTFDDPLRTTSLEIVKYDETLGTTDRFKVAAVKGVWTIPSQEGYPADAKQQVGKAATSVIDLEILGVASDRAGDHEEYGVIEPDEGKLKPGQEGVGTLVVLQEGNEDLARLVIGKEVQGQEGIRYVRRSGQDRVYRVAVNTQSLSTEFSDWIETDLLQLESFALNRLKLNDYSFGAEVTARGELVARIPKDSTITLELDSKSNQWNVAELIDYNEQNEPMESKLAENEQLNTQKINDLRSALDTLKIVDVERKPEGMSGNLKASQSFLDSQEAKLSLAQRGFFAVALPGDEGAQLYSSDGELIAGTNEGVQYLLRFGKIAGVTEGKTDETKDPAVPAKDDADDSSVNRYLLVMAEFNQDLIPKPELKELPTEDKPADKKPAEDKPAEGEADAANSDDDEQDGEEGDEDEQVDDAAASDDEAGAGAATNKTDTTSDAKPAGDTTAGEKDAAGDEKAKQPPEVSIEAQRKAIEAENKRKQTEYDNKVERGKKKVAELNARFADWYYVIPDDVYKKIHLSRADIIQQKPEAKTDASSTQPDDQSILPPANQ